jgi:rhodanese-related sulfurtransferase
VHIKCPCRQLTGDVAPATAWKILSERKDAVLVDVRTRAEWNYVGLPDLDSIAKKQALLEWQVFPSMQPNPEFVSALSGAIADPGTPLLFLCRSGARSAAAAMTRPATVRASMWRTASRVRWTRKQSAVRRVDGRQRDFPGDKREQNPYSDVG